MADLAGAVLGCLLTLAVLSYVIGDNPLYRIAVHLLVGAAAGYAVVVVLVNVLFPQLLLVLLGSLNYGVLLVAAVSWLLAALMFLKLANSQSALGRLPVAYLAGVGAAVAVGGAVTGTLFPQMAATFVSMLPAENAGAGLLAVIEQPVSALVLTVGTICVLMYFWYGGRPTPGGPVEQPVLVKPLARLGQVFVGLTLGALYAGALAASFAYLAERLGAVWDVIRPYVGG